MPSKEIEYKIQLDGNQPEKVKKWLEENADYKGKVCQVDYYLEHPQVPFTFPDRKGFKDADNYFRIRLTQNEDSICLKYYHRDEQGKTTYCDEYETEVKNGRVVLELFKFLGYDESCVIDKTRDIYRYQDFEIVLDQVKDLGNFIEIELKKQVEEVKRGHDLIEDLLKEMEIKKFKRQRRGYVSMLWNLEYDFGEVISL